MLKSTLLQPLKFPNIVRCFNASYTRFSIWGLSTISFNNHPHDLRLSTNNFRAASIEQVSHSLSSAYFQIIMVQRKWFETLILDNDSKFHTKMLVTHMKRHGTQIYPRSGKKPLDRSENDYPPRNHDCMPNETEFVNLQRHSKMNRKT